MSDVARVAGVSASTVSHVVNKTRMVRPETEQAVLAAIKSTGYSGDRIARSLRKGTTETIGLALSTMSHPYFGDLLSSIERASSARAFSLVLAQTHDDPTDEVRALRDLVFHGVDAVILAPSANPAEALAVLSKAEIPVVLIDRIPAEKAPGIDAVGVVNLEPFAQLVEHFAERGHTRIATITSVPELSTVIERLAGYELGIERSGLRLDPDLIQIGHDRRGHPTDQAIERLMLLDSPPTALVMGNDLVTIEVMRALRRRGLSIPSDIVVSAFDDFPWADIFHPRLTVMSQPVDQMGEVAVAMLFDRLADRDLSPRHHRLEPTFEHRDSCGCVSASSPE